nr:GNAT family N-acetyltransferase [uncultured Aminipila sp.]
MKSKKITIRQASNHDIDELERLYDKLNDYLESTINYPGWKKGVYPTRKDAINGINEECLYVAIYNGNIVGSIILRHKPEPAYLEAKWLRDLSYEHVYVIYTFVVHPSYLGQGVGQAMIEFATEHSIKSNVKSIRLDVYEKNLPAIRLYEKCGFKYVGTIDLGLESYGLKWFKIYEKII